MPYVITQPCIGTKDASCVDVCPVDCIHPSPGETFVLQQENRQSVRSYEDVEHLYINPDECIDCGACEPACPVTAIFEESAVPDTWKSFIQSNKDFYDPVKKWTKKESIPAEVAAKGDQPAAQNPFPVTHDNNGVNASLNRDDTSVNRSK